MSSRERKRLEVIEEQVANLVRLVKTGDKRFALWTPFPGPQTDAMESDADVLLYGGQAGGGKTDLLLGLAATRHHNSIVFRRESVQLRGIIKRSRELFDDHGTFNGTNNVWRLPGGRTLELAGVKDPGDERKYQGQPHDLKGFDELAHFTEAQFRYLIGWNRSTRAGQRSRVVAASNPPTGPEGDWLIRYWAPWLDAAHTNPAKPGELRWFTTIDGVDTEVSSGEPFTRNGELIKPRSRTFIAASVRDNPVLMASGYVATLQALPEPLRSKMLFGSFTAGREDNPYQVIPSAWVEAAQKRWLERAQPSTPMTALGVDVARGGKDRTVITARFDTWFAHQHVYPGKETPDGHAAAALVIGHRRDGARVNVDVIGVGSSVYDILADKLASDAVPMHGSQASIQRDKSGQLAFVNQRAEWYWKLREALDPDGGEDLALPPDRELLADLTAPTWRLRSNGIQVESKDEIVKRIGRSPDKGDSLVYAHAQPAGPGFGLFEYYRQHTGTVSSNVSVPTVRLRAPANVGAVQWFGKMLEIGPDRIVEVPASLANDLLRAGYVAAEAVTSPTKV